MSLLSWILKGNAEEQAYWKEREELEKMEPVNGTDYRLITDKMENPRG